ncbi:MAG: hypothetical protein GY795_40465 [Desulfobacterales bacterium]|nr:hypothetical protein [Desulfobacterales bacterium]
MFSKIWIFNILLVACAVFFGIKAHDTWTGNDNTPPKKQEVKKAKPGPVKRIAKQRTAPESAYKVVADRNLFSPDRIEFIPEEPETEEEPEPEVKQLRVSGRTITLYGVIITDDYTSALINNPVRGEDEGRFKWIKEGDSIGDISVTSIRKESILLAENDKKYEILLYDKKKIGKSNIAKKEVKPTIIISGSEKKQRKPAASKAVSSKKQEDEYEIVNTPFGKVRRKKRR